VDNDIIETKPKRIVFVCTSSFTLRTLYKGLFPYFKSKGYQIEAITGDDEFINELPKRDFGGVTPHVIGMERKPSLFADLRSLGQLIRHFSLNQYDLIHVSTPKASLLASIAARLTGNGPILFVYRRCVYENKTGFRRHIYKLSDKLTAALSRRVVPISRQLRHFLVTENVSSKHKTTLVGQGSSNGIDVRYFHSSPQTQAEAEKLRKDHGIAPGQPVILFLGRVIHEKGVDFLPCIFSTIKEKIPDLKMLIVGPEEAERDPIAPGSHEYFENHPDVVRLDYVADPRPLFEVANVFCFPSHFEGFGNVILEAAAMGTPSVGFDVPGVQEAVAHDVSGLLSPFGDVGKMASDIVRILTDAPLGNRLSQDGLERLNSTFGQKAFFARLSALFDEIMAEGRHR